VFFRFSLQFNSAFEASGVHSTQIYFEIPSIWYWKFKLENWIILFIFILFGLHLKYWKILKDCGWKKWKLIFPGFSRHFFPPRKSNYFSSAESKLFNKLLDGNQCKLMRKSMKLKFMNSMEKLLINQLNEQQFLKIDWRKNAIYARDLNFFLFWGFWIKILVFWNLWIQMKSLDGQLIIQLYICQPIWKKLFWIFSSISRQIFYQNCQHLRWLRGQESKI
jgi:hypothetical protein